MKPSRSSLLLAGVALLGVIASFDEMMADARASFLDAAGEKAQDISQSLRRSNPEPPSPAANPLWALPLERWPATRERPIFLPSRRPPPPPMTHVTPVAVRQPAKPPEPERPAVSLIGTVIGTDVQIGIFLEAATHDVVRLRLGEEHRGWVLRLVKAREVTLVKDVAQTLVLDPTPVEGPAVRGTTAPMPVPNSIGTVPIVNTAEYVDEQPLPARGAQRR